MKKEKLISGDYGYINARKKRQLCIVLLWALVIGAVIGVGWIITGTRLNPATVLGIVLVLPAAKAAVGLFLIISYRSGKREDYDAIVKLAGSGCYVLADLVLTQYEGAMYIPLAVIRGGNIFAYAPKQKKTSAQIRQYLTLSVKAAGSTAVPSVDTDFQAFSQRIKKIPALKEGPSKTDEAIRRDVLSRAV